MTPTEVLILLAVFAFVAIVFALLNPPGFIAWCREELRLIAAESWADGLYQHPGTGSDPRVAQMAEKQRELTARMRDEGRHLLSGRAYVPVGTKPAAAPPPMAAKVYPIRCKGGQR